MENKHSTKPEQTSPSLSAESQRRLGADVVIRASISMGRPLTYENYLIVSELDPTHEEYGPEMEAAIPAEILALKDGGELQLPSVESSEKPSTVGYLAARKGLSEEEAEEYLNHLV